MDSELQSAADQAALAAVTQLNGQSGAIARASAAARSLVINKTTFANDGLDPKVMVPVLTFYRGYDKATDAYGAITTSDLDAKVVRVEVGARQAFYALTPIVARLSSGNMTAEAVAGIGSAVCKVPPLYVCNPVAGGFNPDAYRGYGFKMVDAGGSSAAYSPGSIGYLNVGGANSGSPDQRIALGMDNLSNECFTTTSSGVDTGVSGTVLDALNVRFDIFENGWARNTCFDSNNCSPAMNTMKDLVRSKPANKTSCGIATNGNEWQLPPDDDQYLPSNDAGSDNKVTHMGYPMDVCHYPIAGKSPTCGRLGSGTWRADIYFSTNHPNISLASTGLGSNPTRYEVYAWELRTGNLPNVTRNMSTGGQGQGQGSLQPYTQQGAPVCKAGLPSGPLQPDRRVISVAVVTNCAALSGGSTTAEFGDWMTAFLVQPSIARSGAGTNANDLYLEIIGRSKPLDSGSSGQVVRRDVPYLIR
jgi:hypothetical protein